MSAACPGPFAASFVQDDVPDSTGPGLWGDVVFEVSVASVGSHGCWLGTSGEVDLATAGQLGSVLEQQCKAGRCFASLDLSEVSFMDCAGLEMLADAHRRFLDAGGTLSLTGVGPRIMRLLELTGLDQTLFTTLQATGPPLAQRAVTRTVDGTGQAQAEALRARGRAVRDGDTETGLVRPIRTQPAAERVVSTWS